MKNHNDNLVAAIGKASEALEYVERARGQLYSFHQLMGRADLQFGESVDMLRDANLDADAQHMETEIVGRNVIDGRWTFQLVEEFEALYYEPAVAEVRDLERKYLDGKRHVYESRMKDERRTKNLLAHENRPPAAYSPVVDLDTDR